MKTTDRELQVLAALAKEHAEARRPIATLIVMAACNARTGAEQDGVIASLAGLKRQGLVMQHEDSWAATPDGHRVACKVVARQEPASQAALMPMESGFKKRSHATLRPMVGGAPKPITRPSTKPAVKDLLTADDQWREDRIDAIGQNGATGDHYANVVMSSELLERCAAMHLTLIAQSEAAREEGSDTADQEMAWLLETGRMLLAASAGQEPVEEKRA